MEALAAGESLTGGCLNIHPFRLPPPVPQSLVDGLAAAFGEFALDKLRFEYDLADGTARFKMAEAGCQRTLATELSSRQPTVCCALRDRCLEKTDCVGAAVGITLFYDHNQPRDGIIDHLHEYYVGV
ncbi:hypothetical protein ColLi_09199 [Colletotrichum liriopes]|uniref:Uncharacterized protein n=1 Tax=Colletotrichum liriopes TaxID=708192 RepID=A0AA37GU04_9PEZI|nr:hypothetical protein ColLi_09199 [Colletotrichum liriopes]